MFAMPGTTMLCKSYREIYVYYWQIAKKLENCGLRILKTDTHNESGIWSHVSIPLAPVLATGNSLTCIEIDPATLELAQKQYPELDLRLGDVLTWQGEYDIVLDFSTIDHVEDYRAVLENYRKMSENLSCIVWLSDTRPSRDKQYFFPFQGFRDAFADVYGQYEEIGLYDEAGAQLIHFMSLNDRIPLQISGQ